MKSKDPAGRVDEMDNSPIIIQQQPDGSNNNKMEDCISGGRYYLHGTTWHPVMGPFGPMDCVNCQCRSGRIECQRLECPSRPALNCERPVKVTGRCCPVCPLISEGDIQGIKLHCGTLRLVITRITSLFRAVDVRVFIFARHWDPVQHSRNSRQQQQPNQDARS